MDIQEFSDTFDTLLNSYSNQLPFGEQSSKADIVLNEYEKSLYLTKAQEEIVVNLYNGRNQYGLSFESTEEARRYLETLIKTVICIPEDSSLKNTTANSVFFKLQPDVAFITMEQITYDDSSLGCYNGSTASVQPVTQDEYNKIKNNPFRGPTKYRAIRLDAGDNTVEIISKYKVKDYLLKYLAQPKPIILEKLPDNLSIRGENDPMGCKLHPILHNIILERAVQIALQVKRIGINT